MFELIKFYFSIKSFKIIDEKYNPHIQLQVIKEILKR